MLCKVYPACFCTLESGGAFDPASEVDIFCLHLVFLPRINKALGKSIIYWKKHTSPLQLFYTEGFCEMAAADQAYVNLAHHPTWPILRLLFTFGETEVTAV